MNLLPYIKIIEDLKPLSQRLYYRIEHWKNYNFKNSIIQDDINFIVDNYKNGISRQEIIDYFKHSDHILRRGFILTMIWGHGFSEHGKADNRGPWKVSQMLDNLNVSETILLKANKRLDKDDLIGAHEEFNDMKRCRVNFFSKFLYFLGRAKEMDYYPLIFDARVANTLGLLTSTNQDLTSILNIQPNQDSYSYNNYVIEMHSLAKENNLNADKIEYFLFKGI